MRIGNTNENLIKSTQDKNNLNHENVNNNFYKSESKENFDNHLNENNFPNDLNDIQKLKRLFLIYSGNEKKLHSQKYLKLLTDAEMLDRDFDSKYADIVFFAASKSKTHIEFSGFCELILKISEIKFPLDFIKNQALALNKILNEFVFPLLNKIYSNNCFNYKSSGLSKNKGIQLHTDYSKLILKINSNSDVKEILEKHLYLLIKIYQKYFPWETLNIAHDKKTILSEKSFVRFSKDFEIQPNLISLIRLNDIYVNSTLNTKLILSTIDSILGVDIKNQGSYFTLFHFITCLYLISIQSILNYCSINNSNKNTLNNDELYERVSNSKTLSFKDNKMKNEIDYKIDDFAEVQDLSNLFDVIFNKKTF